MLAVIDGEFTGLKEHDRLCELAVVHVDLGAIEPPKVAFRARFRAPVEMSEGASRANGITDDDLAGLPPFSEYEAAFRGAVLDRTPVAYNAVMDHAMLLREGVDLGWPWVDLFVVANVVDKYKRGKSLADVATRRGIVVDAHGAAGDSLTAALLCTPLLRECYRHERDEGRRPDWSSIDLLLGWMTCAALAQEREFCSYRAGKGDVIMPRCPWHERAGVPLPLWHTSRPLGTCPACGAGVRWHIGQDGSTEVRGADEEIHECRRALQCA